MPSPAGRLPAAGRGRAAATLPNAVADDLAPLGILATELPLSPDRIARLVRAAQVR